VGYFIKSTIKHSISTKYTTFVDRIYESLFINITLQNGKKLVIGNVYRPGNHPSLTQTALYETFSEILSNTISTLLDDRKQFYLAGDFNIDILKYNQNTRATDFVDLLFFLWPPSNFN